MTRSYQQQMRDAGYDPHNGLDCLQFNHDSRNHGPANGGGDTAQQAAMRQDMAHVNELARRLELSSPTHLKALAAELKARGNDPAERQADRPIFRDMAQLITKHLNR